MSRDINCHLMCRTTTTASKYDHGVVKSGFERSFGAIWLSGSFQAAQYHSDRFVEINLESPWAAGPMADSLALVFPGLPRHCVRSRDSRGTPGAPRSFASLSHCGGLGSQPRHLRGLRSRIAWGTGVRPATKPLSIPPALLSRLTLNWGVRSTHCVWYLSRSAHGPN